MRRRAALNNIVTGDIADVAMKMPKCRVAAVAPCWQRLYDGPSLMLSLPPRLEFHQGTLTLSGVKRDVMEKAPTGIPWQWNARIAAWRTDAWFYPQVAPLLSRFAPPIADDVPQWQSVRWPKVALPLPRPEQAAAIDAWLASERGCVVMPRSDWTFRPTTA